MGEQHLPSDDPFERLTLDEDFVRGGRYEPPARTRQALARYEGRETSWRRPFAPPADGAAAAGRRPATRLPSDRSARAVSPIFVGLVLGLGAALVWTWESGARAAVFTAVVLGWLVSLCLHEFAHALLAHRGGDSSVAVRGYLRLDPRRYVHPVLSFVLPVLFVLVGGIGLPGGAVWIDHAALRTRRARSLTSLAGPATNAICAAVCLAPLAVEANRPEAFTGHLAFWAALGFLGFLQLTATIINMLPVPGLDGWGVLEPYLPPHVVRIGRTIAPFGTLLLFFVLFRSAFVSGGLGRAILHLETALGVPGWLAAYGDHLFRFWS